MAEKKKIVKYRKPVHLNIGVVVFGIIFIYLIFNVFSYFTTEHVSVYEIGQGTIAENNTYNGLILREEKVVSSDYNGDVDYYLRDGAKAGVTTLVCSVDENGDVAGKLEQTAEDGAELSSEDYVQLGETISKFDKSYLPDNYYQVYSFKEELDARLMEAVNQSALDSLGDYAANAESNQTFHLSYAPEPGVVAYYTDGYENVTVDTLTPEHFNVLNYTKNNLKQSAQRQSGDSLYKLATSENWNIIFPVSQSTYDRLAEDNVVKLQFKKDGITCWVNYEFKKLGDTFYMVLSLKNHMVRFLNERFTEVELLLDEETGLKLPNTAITEKDFFVVPKGFFTKGGDSSQLGLLVQATDKKGKSTMQFVPTSLYCETEDAYYIEADDNIQAGTVVLLTDSSKTYTIGETAALQGVYNVNKGYAVFKRIEILFQNEEYAIVRTGTKYGLSLYDHIALEGNKVNEDEVLQ